jgi:hypothetical protein
MSVATLGVYRNVGSRIDFTFPLPTTGATDVEPQGYSTSTDASRSLRFVLARFMPTARSILLADSLAHQLLNDYLKHFCNQNKIRAKAHQQSRISWGEPLLVCSIQ